MEIGNRVCHDGLGWGVVTDLDSVNGSARVKWDGERGESVVSPLSALYCSADHEPRYRIIRMYQRGGSRTIERGLTLAQARAHCSDPETSSSTATSSKARARTRRMGPWFDGYDTN